MGGAYQAWPPTTDQKEAVKTMGFRDSQRAQVILKMFSLGAVVLLIVAGGLGCSSIVLGGGVTYFIGSLYAIAFGLLALCVEIKDKVPFVSAVYGLVDEYLKFLTLQRGKGAFYFFVGLLVFFMAPVSGEVCTEEVVAVPGANQTHVSRTCSTPHYLINIGVINIAALILASVGIMHLFRIIKEAGALRLKTDMSASVPTLQPLSVGAGGDFGRGGFGGGSTSALPPPAAKVDNAM